VSHGIPLCSTQQPLSTYKMSFKSEKLFVDGQKRSDRLYKITLLCYHRRL